MVTSKEMWLNSALILDEFLLFWKVPRDNVCFGGLADKQLPQETNEQISLDPDQSFYR